MILDQVTTQPTQLVVDGTPSAHTVASINMEMIFCPPGTFMMGSPTSESGRGTDETQHQVTLTNGFYLGKYEVTQAQYQTVVNGNSEGLSADPSQFKGSNRPVEKVSWADAQVFLAQLNVIEQSAGRLPTGWKYVLPTEAQWEYACRAGTTTAYSWGNDINSSQANYNWDGVAYDGNDSKQTVEVGQFPPTLGLFRHAWNVSSGSTIGRKSMLVDQTNPEDGIQVVSCLEVVLGSLALKCVLQSQDDPSNSYTTPGFRVAFQRSSDTANPKLIVRGSRNYSKAKPSSSLASRPTMHVTEISPIRSWSRERWI
jgi:hypothetical protein